MTWPDEVNIGMVVNGPGQTNVTGPVVGKQVNHGDRGGHPPEPAPTGRPGGQRRADIGVVTVLPEETQAVVAVLARAQGFRSGALDDGAQVHEADVPSGPGALRVVAMQALDPGPPSAALAYRTLRAGFGPPLVLLVGIAGGISPIVAIGDVVIADQVIAYDARRETSAGPHRRGEAYVIAPAVRHRVNEFRRQHGHLVRLPTMDTVRVALGPIGSGGAVITDSLSELRTYLSGYNEKTLAVETEAIGLARAAHEEDRRSASAGWLVIRGISDHADAAKGTRDHARAAANAAEVMALLLPLLGSTVDG
jgi:adenosylhomocysteine nucleosidase